MATKKDSSKIKRVQTKELGGSGTTIYRGVVSNAEYSSSLSTEYGARGLTIYNRMRKSDPIVKASLKIIKLGILQAEWFVEPASDDPQDMLIRDFIEEALFQRMNKSWEEVLKDILTYLDFGFYVTEKVFKVEDDKQGVPRIWWKKMAYRDQRSISKFQTKNGKDGITQILEGDKSPKEKNPSTPIEKLLIFTNDKEGENWRGVSVLRSAYKPWFFKENFEKIDAIGFEREAVGLPVFTMPANPNPKDVEEAEERGRNIRANEKAHLILPFGWEFDIKYPSGGSRRNADEAIKRFNRDILANVLAQFLDLGSGTTGSRALSVDQSDAFYRSLMAVAGYISSIWNQYAIVQLVDLNFNNVKNYPKLKAGGVEKVNLDLFSTAIQRLVLAGVLTPDDELEDYIRNKFRLPEKVEAEIETGGISGKGEKTKKPASQQQKQEEEQKQKEKEKEIKGKEKIKTKKYSFQQWRPKTFAEEKVNFASISKQMDIAEEEISRELPKILAPEIASLKNDARIALQMGDAKRVEDMFIRFKDEVTKFLIDKLNKSFEAGKLSAANELDIPAPKTDNRMISMITTQANAMAQKITDDLLNQAKLTTLGQIQQNTPVDEALSSLETLMTNQLARSIQLTASAATVGGINMGRDSIFGENRDKIYGLQRSELLDDRICNYCLSMDGRVIQPDDELAKHGQFHFMCRGIWVAIGKDEAEKPEISGVPAQLRERVGTLSEFKRLDKPFPLKGSLAEEFIKRKKK